MKKINYLAAPVLLALSSHAMALDVNIDNECNLELNNNLSITPDHILIKKNDETLIDIYQNQMVFVRGELQDLSASETALVEDYSNSIRQSVPEITELAIAAVEAAFEGINVALGDLGNMDALRDAFDEVKYQIEQSHQTADGYYSFQNGNFTMGQNDENVEHAIEEVMEEIMPTLVGNLLTQVGTAMASGEADFSNLENLGERIEQEVELRTAHIEAKANAFCQQLKRVDDIETQLIDNNPELKDMDLIALKVDYQSK